MFNSLNTAIRPLSQTILTRSYISHMQPTVNNKKHGPFYAYSAEFLHDHQRSERENFVVKKNFRVTFFPRRIIFTVRYIRVFLLSELLRIIILKKQNSLTDTMDSLECYKSY